MRNGLLIHRRPRGVRSIISSAGEPISKGPHPSREGARRVRSPRSHISGLVVGLTLCPFATYL